MFWAKLPAEPATTAITVNVKENRPPASGVMITSAGPANAFTEGLAVNADGVTNCWLLAVKIAPAGSTTGTDWLTTMVTLPLDVVPVCRVML